MVTNPDKPRWTILEACSLLDLERNRVKQWLRKGWIKPAESAPAKGRPYLFTFNDLVKMGVLKILGDFRMLDVIKGGSGVAGAVLVGSLPRIDRIVDILRIGPEPEGGWATKSEISPRGDEELVLSVNLDLIRRRILEKI